MVVDGCRPLSIKDKRIKFAVICRDLGERATTSIDRLDIDKWTAEKGYTRGTAQVYAKNIDTVQRFFGGHKRIRRHIDERIPQTWTPAEVAKLFKAAEKKQPAIIPALTALFFAGVRPHEMMRLDWGSVDCSARVLRLGAAVTKTRTMRNVELSDNAVAWFAAHRSTGPLVPSEAQYRTMREVVMKAAKITRWPVDIARHTFATATYQSTGDAGKTMKQLGHFGNPDIFARHYKGQPWSADDAAAYWQITPGKKASATVVAFAAAG
jgi:integrase